MNIYQDSTRRASAFYVSQDGVANKRIAYRVKVCGVAGDVVSVCGQVEVTNDLGFNVGIGMMLIRTTDPSSLTGTKLMPAVMENCTPDVHHKVFQPSAHDVLPGNGYFYYSLIVWGCASAGSGAITIEDGFGKLSALVMSVPPSCSCCAV